LLAIGEGATPVFRSISYYIRHTLRSLNRNRWMGAASIATTAIAFFILGIFIMGVLNIQAISKKIESNLEMVVWIEADTERSEVENIKTYVENLGNVTQVKLVPKEEGIKEINKNYFNSETDLLKTLNGDNPLPDYLVVKVAGPEFVKDVATKINALSNVDKVDYGQEYLDKLMALMYWMRLIGAGVIILFLLAVIFLIGNTIRLTVYARNKEIQIMRFVGASNWFIRWPFLLEGLVLGLVGSLIAASVLYISYIVLIDNVAKYVSFLPLIKDTLIVRNISLLIVAIGTVLGGIVSFLSLGRYLRL